MSEAHDLMRKYLEQRDLLDEGPVVLERGQGDRMAEMQRGRGTSGDEKSGARQVREEMSPTGEAVDAAPTTPAFPATPATESQGKQIEAPPPNGITIQAPSTDLFTDDDSGGCNDLSQVADAVRDCEQCRLCESRTNTVPGEGPADARLVVVGEGPGAREDETGRPFVGRAGELLTDILRAIKLERDAVFICNIVKCRPPSNRTPRQEEIEACVPYLYKQIDIVHPDVILAMGSTAITTLLQRKQSLGAFRGKVHSFRGMPLVATYHPAALLRNPNWKRPTWDDVRIARRLLDE